MRIFQALLKIPATTLWNLSEWSGFGLGRFAPFVFGLMIGSKPVRKKAMTRRRTRDERISKTQAKEWRECMIQAATLLGRPPVEDSTDVGISASLVLGIADKEREIAALKIALEESLKLQSHYAMLLNVWDGGQRLQFSDAEAWIERLRLCGRIPAKPRESA